MKSYSILRKKNISIPKILWFICTTGTPQIAKPKTLPTSILGLVRRKVKQILIEP